MKQVFRVNRKLSKRKRLSFSRMLVFIDAFGSFLWLFWDHTWLVLRTYFWLCALDLPQVVLGNHLHCWSNLAHLSYMLALACCSVALDPL